MLNHGTHALQRGDGAIAMCAAHLAQDHAARVDHGRDRSGGVSCELLELGEMRFHFRYLDPTRRSDQDETAVVAEREHRENCNACGPKTNGSPVGHVSATTRKVGRPLLDGLKRFFVVPFLASLVGIAIHAARAYVLSGAWPWLGPLIVAGGFLVYLGAVVVFRRARTAAYPVVVLLTMSVGTALAGYAAYDDLGAQPLVLASIAVALEVVYLGWYSFFARDSSPVIAVGQRLPDFEAEEGGRLVRASELSGRPAVLLFYRGNWCPLCMAQIREIAKSYRELSELGAEVVLISGQPHEKTAALARRFDVPFRFWVDGGLRAAKRLGIFHAGATPLGFEVLGYDADGVLPTAIVIDAEGTILLADQTDNYRVRPEPETFLEALR